MFSGTGGSDGRRFGFEVSWGWLVQFRLLFVFVRILRLLFISPLLSTIFLFFNLWDVGYRVCGLEEYMAVGSLVCLSMREVGQCQLLKLLCSRAHNKDNLINFEGSHKPRRISLLGYKAYRVRGIVQKLLLGLRV